MDNTKTKLLLFTFLSLFIVNITCAQETNIVPGNLLVMLNSSATPEQLSQELQSLNGVSTGLKAERLLTRSMNIYLFSFDATSVNQDKVLHAVRQSKLVNLAQFNHIVEERNAPNDSLYNSMWDMHNTGQSGGAVAADINAIQAWDITTGGLTADGDTIVVAVVDAGFDLTHNDLNYWKNNQEIANNGIDDDNNGFVDDYLGWNGATATDSLPVAGHGTHVCGTVGARGNNQIGITGVNWNVKIMAISYGNSGSAFEANVVASYGYVMEQRKLYNQTNGVKGAFVVSTNSSFGVNNGQPASYPLWCAMYDSLGSVGILSAAATANSTINVDTQGDIPTACTSNWLITVTNTTSTDTKYGSCGYGSTSIDLGAPGTSILSTYLNNGYSTLTGTSMATPHVAGAIALMLSTACPAFISAYKADPSGMALIIKDSILQTTDSIATLANITVSGGRLNLYKAVKAVAAYCPGLYVEELIHKNKTLSITNLYPNPASKMLTVNYTSADNSTITFYISNALGQKIIDLPVNVVADGSEHQQWIDLTPLSAGIYFLNISSPNAISNAFKLSVY